MNIRGMSSVGLWWAMEVTHLASSRHKPWKLSVHLLKLYYFLLTDTKSSVGNQMRWQHWRVWWTHCRFHQLLSLPNDETNVNMLSELHNCIKGCRTHNTTEVSVNIPSAFKHQVENIQLNLCNIVRLSLQPLNWIASYIKAQLGL